ncbi:MFS transporter [Glycomyces algeriensis]|uniref:MFS transporter n=1 Tax=Glycomyces algeriensis TaxID=256037 RepID=A0A9W6LHL3_9ACTN|nr:MFS transporter [Glycomyces algeriensis]MDA1364208.1 MFS transporter [Glycomyces algeriensis]MDR7350233.1 DHA2 family multidrug resistance protein-like MFS transporter [Glycomyces algeriensis]GLI42944.1 MFS transporter [Glycomyces algeriensis]
MAATLHAPQEPRARISAKQGWALATLVLPVLLISIDMTVLGFAVPFLSEDLAPTSSQLLWIVDVYGFVLAGLLVTMGTLGDRVGRRKLLVIGSAAFAVASVLAAYAPSAEALIAARALLGLAGATLMPTTLALMRNLFHDDRQRKFAIAIWASGFSAGAALGPILGGWLLEHFWWGSVFLMAAPVSIAVVLAAPFLLPESKDPNPGRIDVPSVALSFLAMFPFVYGVKTIAEHGVTVATVAAIAAGAVAGMWFVRRQKRLEHPLIDVGLFRLRRFSASLATNFTIVFAMISALFLLTQYLQLVLGFSPMQAGLLLLPGMVVSVVSGLFAVRMSERTGMVRTIIAGLVLVIAGFAAMTFIGIDSGAAVVASAFALIGAGSGLAQTVTNDAILAAAPADRAGAASAISETAYELGGAMGVALLGSLATGIYRTEMADAPVEAETLGEAAHVAATLPAETGDALMEAARTAFTDGLRTVALVAAALVLIATVAVGRALRTRSSER